MQQTQYSEATVSQLLYSRTPKVVKAIKERQVGQITYPRGARSGYGPQKTIEFDIKTDMLLDLPTHSFDFTVSTTDADNEIANAMDFVNELSCYYNDTELFRYQNCNTWQNQFLIHNASKHYLDNDLNVLCGFFNQFSPVKPPTIAYVAGPPISVSTTYSRDGVKCDGRRYSVSLALLHPFWSMVSFLPIFGNTLRVKILTAKVVEALSLVGGVNDTYVLNDVEIVGDVVVVKSDYAKQIMNEMANGTIRLSFLSFETGRMNVNATPINNLKYLFNLSNLLSIFLLRQENAKKDAIGGGGVPVDRHRLYTQSHDTVRPLANLKVKTGSLYLTEPSGIDSKAKFYTELQKTLGDIGVSAIDGKGEIDYNTWAQATYATWSANPHVDRSYYPCSMVGINCEKLIQDDNEGVVNSGLSSVSANATNELQFTYDCAGNAPLATDEIWINMAHKRALVFENGAYTVEV